MAIDGHDVFDETIQKTDLWLKQVGEELQLSTRWRAYEALRAVLHAVRDQLTTDQAAHLAAQLPMLVRGLYFEGWKPARSPHPQRSREKFLERVADEVPMGPGQEEAARLTRGVLAVVMRHISQGEYEQIRQAFPEKIRELWPEYGETAIRHRGGREPAPEPEPVSRSGEDERRKAA
jgi:uncharacterized protein (DUF2267 family)